MKCLIVDIASERFPLDEVNILQGDLMSLSVLSSLAMPKKY